MLHMGPSQHLPTQHLQSQEETRLEPFLGPVLLHGRGMGERATICGAAHGLPIGKDGLAKQGWHTALLTCSQRGEGQDLRENHMQRSCGLSFQAEHRYGLVTASPRSIQCSNQAGMWSSKPRRAKKKSIHIIQCLYFFPCYHLPSS